MMPGQMAPQQPADSWAVPVMTRQKYQTQFVNTDRGRTGFLAGAQARNLLLQTGLPQNILAQIWGLSDVDADGRLSTEEFILAGHFCDLAMKGEPLPPAGEESCKLCTALYFSVETMTFISAVILKCF